MDESVLSFNLHRPSCVHLAFCKSTKGHSSGQIVNYTTVDAYRTGEFLWWFHSAWSYILHTHNHMGLINKEHRFFVSMTKEYGMMPQIECLCLLLKWITKSQQQFIIGINVISCLKSRYILVFLGIRLKFQAFPIIFLTWSNNSLVYHALQDQYSCIIFMLLESFVSNL